MYDTHNKNCQHETTQFFRVPGGRVKELCVESHCWANVRGDGKYLPCAEARTVEAYPLCQCGEAE